MTNLNVRFFVILKKPPILFIPNNIQAKAGQKLPLKTGQKMNFPPVDKRLYYIYCNQLFRDIFRQAPTCPFFALFPKRRVNPTEEPAKPGTIIYSSAKADGKRELAARGSALPVSSPVNLHLRFKLISTIMN